MSADEGGAFFEPPQRPIHELTDREILILMCERQAVMNVRVTNLHGRVASLETWRTFLAGAWAVVSLAGAWMLERRNP